MSFASFSAEEVKKRTIPMHRWKSLNIFLFLYVRIQNSDRYVLHYSERTTYTIAGPVSQEILSAAYYCQRDIVEMTSNAEEKKFSVYGRGVSYLK
jgi:hypothetical protein